jgi:aspartyl-tRNA(Asn)/glutamyl-tRNA(Gln) amidotransferase subunit C
MAANDDLHERISLDEVKKVAKLARLHHPLPQGTGHAGIGLSDAELEQMRGELDAILDSMSALSKLDVEGVPPTFLVLETGSPLRADIPREGIRREEALRAAASSEAGAFAVPKVMEGE